MKRIDLRKVWTGLITVSLMCIASCYGLQAQNGTDPIPAERKGKWGYVNQAGKKAVSFKYEKAGAFSEGLAPVRLKGKWGYIKKLF